jgi:hypothetical protein
VDASGRGSVYSWIVVHHTTVPTAANLLPYSVVLVALEDDPDILIPGQFDGDRTELCSDLAVVAEYRDVTEDVTVVHWRPQTGNV